MTWLRLAMGACVLSSMLPAGAATTTAPGRASSFHEATQATLVGTRPASGFFLVELLAQAGEPASAESLRRELWRLELAAMRGETVDPRLTIGEATVRGAALPPQGADFVAEWRRAFNAAARLSFASARSKDAWTAVPLPEGVTDAAALRPIEAGLWWQPRGDGSGRVLLSAELQNNGPSSLAPQGLRLRLGSERDGVVLDCLSYPAPTGSLAREREIFRSGDTQQLGCEAVGVERLRDILPALLALARDGHQPAVLLPRDPADPPKGERWYWRGSNYLDKLRREWTEQLKVAADPAHARREWIVSTTPLAPPTLAPPPPTWRERAAATFAQVKEKIGLQVFGLVLAWMLFALVRTLWRDASPETHTVATLVITAVVTLPFLFGAWGGGLGGGDGWSRLGTLAGGFGVLAAGAFVAVGALLLQALHRVLDADETTWRQTIASGWRRSFQMFGATSRAEFWGFLAFGVVALVLAAPFRKPWTTGVAAVLLVPTGTLAMRRVTSLTAKEFWTGLAIIVAAILDVMA